MKPFVALGSGLALAACSAAATGPAAAPAQTSARVSASSQDLSNFADRITAFHNRVRAEAGVAPLRWDPQLAAAAAAYGPGLAALGDSLAHSPRASRPGQGENLWVGTVGAYTLESALGAWAAERSLFRPGIFPAVSTTRWEDVAHYTQMIWPGTTHIGCALHRTGRWDYLICRYTPSGNRDGQRVP